MIEDIIKNTAARLYPVGEPIIDDLTVDIAEEAAVAVYAVVNADDNRVTAEIAEKAALAARAFAVRLEELLCDAVLAGE